MPGPVLAAEDDELKDPRSHDEGEGNRRKVKGVGEQGDKAAEGGTPPAPQVERRKTEQGEGDETMMMMLIVWMAVCHTKSIGDSRGVRGWFDFYTEHTSTAVTMAKTEGAGILWNPRSPPERMGM